MQMTSIIKNDRFLYEYTTKDAISKYSRATAGCGVNYLLDHDYKEIYLAALNLLPAGLRQEGIRILEFGCGAGMNLLHLISALEKGPINIETAVWTDFAPGLIDAAQRERR